MTDHSAFPNPHSALPQTDPADPFGPVIYSYTRADAVADGQQIDVSTTAQEAGIRFPFYLTRAVWDNYVTVPPDVTGQDEAGRLWDLVWMTRFAIIRSQPCPRPRERERVAEGRVRDAGPSRLPVALYVRNDNQRSRLVKLVAVCGPRDFDDPAPAITLMLPDED